jgi:hypothetical protein
VRRGSRRGRQRSGRQPPAAALLAAAASTADLKSASFTGFIRTGRRARRLVGAPTENKVNFPRFTDMPSSSRRVKPAFFSFPISCWRKPAILSLYLGLANASLDVSLPSTFTRPT